MTWALYYDSKLVCSFRAGSKEMARNIAKAYRAEAEKEGSKKHTTIKIDLWKLQRVSS